MRIEEGGEMFDVQGGKAALEGLRIGRWVVLCCRLHSQCASYTEICRSAPDGKEREGEGRK
jgi:hypothetical protein